MTESEFGTLLVVGLSLFLVGILLLHVMFFTPILKLKIRRIIIYVIMIVMGFWLTLIPAVSIVDIKQLKVSTEMTEITGKNVDRRIMKSINKYEVYIGEDVYLVELLGDEVIYKKK